MVEPYLHLNGRRMILTDETEVNIGNVVQILRKALPYHWKNRSEISYLWSYYKGRQPILNRVKEVRPEITNKIVENRANEIVSFKSGYLMGEPLQYVSRGNAENIANAINQLNEFVFAEEKPAKDKELADWFHICGTSFRMVLPDEMAGEDDESPFEIYTLDPRNTFVVYNNGLGNKPILGVKYVVDENGVVHYSCYSDHEYFEIVESKVIFYDTHILGEIPIIEYPLNMARIGAFELVIPLLDEDKAYLQECLIKIDAWISSRGLKLSPKKTQLFKVTQGIKFLGFRFRLTKTGKVVMTLLPEKLSHERRKLRKLVERAKQGYMTKEEVDRCYESWKAHVGNESSKKRKSPGRRARRNCHNLIICMDQYYKNLWRESKCLDLSVQENSL